MTPAAGSSVDVAGAGSSDQDFQYLPSSITFASFVSFSGWNVSHITASSCVCRREERKVVSVLFGDLVGFTNRSEQLDVDEVRGTLEPYQVRLRQVLEQFGGTVEKFIGDAALELEFAARDDHCGAAHFDTFDPVRRAFGSCV